MADLVERLPQRVGHRGGEHGVLHVVDGLAFERGGDEVGPEEREVGALVEERDHVAVDAFFEHGGPPAGADVLADERVAGVERDVAEVLGLGVVRHLEAARVVGVEHGAVGGDLDDDALDLGELIERVDALEPEVVGGDVEHGADVAAREAEPAAEQPAARRLQHGHVDRRVAEDHPRARRPRHVALDGERAVDVDAVGRRHADGVRRRI